MTVLVTGGAGYIGSHAVLDLLDAGEKVVVIDDLSSTSYSSVTDPAQFYDVSVSDFLAVEHIIRRHEIKSVMHFAGSIVVSESVAFPDRYYRNNVGGTVRLLEAAVVGGVENFIFSSTAAVYGPGEGGRSSEDGKLDPISPYGRSKLMCETIIADVAQAYPIRTGVLRYFNVAGADPAGRSGQSSRVATHLVKIACEAAAGKRDSVYIYGTDYPTEDGTCVRDYVHVTDLVAAHRLVLNKLRGGESGLTFNVGSGRGYSVREVIDAVRAIPGASPFSVIESERRPGDPARILANSARLRAAGWQPEHDSIEEIVTTALDWERKIGR